MPNFRKHRDETYRRHTEAGDDRLSLLSTTLSAEAAFKIIKNKRIWMRTRIACSDYRESATWL